MLSACKWSDNDWSKERANFLYHIAVCFYYIITRRSIEIGNEIQFLSLIVATLHADLMCSENPFYVSQFFDNVTYCYKHLHRMGSLSQNGKI